MGRCRDTQLQVSVDVSKYNLALQRLMCRVGSYEARCDLLQPDIYFIEIKKSYRLIIDVYNTKLTFLYIYKEVSLVKAHKNIHAITYRIKIMLSGFTIINV